MRLVIAGGRNINPILAYVRIQDAMYRLRWFPDVILSGGADGVDRAGEGFARRHGIKLERFPVTQDEWREHGRAAGPLRNRRMAEAADHALVVWDGLTRGSASMVREARRAGLRLEQDIVDRSYILAWAKFWTGPIPGGRDAQGG